MRKWLVRTSNNQIFGPISKQKAIELCQNKNISPDDEICMGNGYWFYIRETELLKKYLLGDEEQSFSPSPLQGPLDKKEVKLPGPDDLDYPKLVSGPKLNPPVSKVVPNPNSPRPSATPRAHYKIPPLQPKTQRDDRYLIILLIIFLILLGLFLRKYTDIFNFTGILTKEGNAYASQVPLSTYYKKIIFQSKKGKLLGKTGLNGVTFDIHLDKKTDQCLLFEKTSFPLTWHLTNMSKDHLIKQCVSASTEAIAMAHLFRISSHKDSLNRVKRTAEIWGPTKSKEIIKIYQVKKSLPKKIIIEDALEKTNVFLAHTDQKASEILQILNRAENHLLSKMALMAIYYKLKNNGRSHSLLHSILSQDRDFFFIMAEKEAETRNKKKLEKQLVTLMKFLANKLDPNEWRFLVLYLKYYSPEFINNHFPISLSLNEIRKFRQTFRWGISYPALWVKESQNRSTQNDIQQYLVSVFKKGHSKELWRNHFWLFSFFTPSRQEVRHFIKEEMARLQKTQSHYKRFLFLKVLGNRELYSLLKDHLNLQSTFFNLKRKTFRSMLEKGDLINFSLLHLLAMGDRSEDTLWWKIL